MIHQALVTDEAWHALARSRGAGLFHSPPWLCAVSDAYGFDIRASVMLNPAGTPIAGIPYCELDDLAGRRIVSVPFSDSCDPLFSSIDEWQTMFAALQTRGLPIHLRCLFEQRVIADGALTVTKRARWHRLALTGSRDAIWQAVAPATRRAIRRAEAAGVEIRPMAGHADRDAFHRMHVALRKTKYRLLAQPLRFFEAIEQRFQAIGGWHSLAAWRDERMIAATVYLRWGDVLYYKFNTSALDGLDVRPNNLLVWEGIKLAKALGCSALDLGPSDDDQPGLIRFKAGFGAEGSELRFLRWTPPGWQPDRLETRKMFGEMTQHFTEAAVPNDITARAGTLLYRFFA